MQSEFIVLIASARPSPAQWQAALDRDRLGLMLGEPVGEAATLGGVPAPFEVATCPLGAIPGLADTPGRWREAVQLAGRGADPRYAAAAGAAALGLMAAVGGQMADRRSGLLDVTAFMTFASELGAAMKRLDPATPAAGPGRIQVNVF